MRRHRRERQNRTGHGTFIEGEERERDSKPERSSAGGVAQVVIKTEDVAAALKQ